MTDNLPPARWRLTGMAAKDDSTYTVSVVDDDGETREYEFTAENVDIAGSPVLLVSGLEFGDDTIWDREGAVAVSEAVRAFHIARQRTLRLGRPS
ncbi:hypothetical protein GCM10022225_63600 [Plantactinospora mayteni]|uniref:DUF1508 domain-containing protein n=1 Tax=Plantactinospora mayteni TaxID=566021 RepID=A0ABQ4F052_9ACTN|nr:hypothetical protein [Plantactinospora mayteni]GIH00289.1 hypothetical protein Pma05_68610 [Plantactinospora mayteni]